MVTAEHDLAPLALRDCAWVIRGRDAPSEWLRRQVVDTVVSLCGATPGLAGAVGEGEGKAWIVVGSPEDSEAVREAGSAGLLDPAALGPTGYGLRRVRIDGRPVLLLYAGQARHAAYAAFELFERLGCRFLVSRDVVPPADPDRLLPGLTDLARTGCAWRGIWFQYCFATNSSMSLVDYARLFDQMVKMRLDRIVFYHFENEPFVDYAFRGERKLVGDIAHPDSGYLSYGRHFSGSYRVADIPIGAERFGRRHVAPLELQDVGSSTEALDAGRAFMHEVHRLAASRGIRCWLSFLPQFVPLNLLVHTRRMPRPHLHWSGLVSAADPVVDEINRVRLEAIWQTYPDLEGIFLGIPEGYYEDPYEDSRSLVEARRPDYERAFQLHRKYWGAYWSHDETLLERHIRQDIGFSDILLRTVRIGRELDPACRLGVITVCKAYLLTHLHGLLPLDVPFADIESRSLWTVDGAPLHLFDEMRDRECALIPRAVDDGSMAGMQFDLELYARDRYLQSAREHGTAGLIVQTTHVRGNEHNLGYLAAGMWDDALTSEAFYDDYARAVFGPTAAATACRAFRLLEENEIALGGRGGSNMPWNKVPGQIEVLRSLRDYPAPFFGVPYGEAFVARCRQQSERYAAAVVRLERAGELYREALAASTPGGRRELGYLLGRNDGYAHHLRCLIRLSEVYATLRDLLPSPRPLDEMCACLDRIAADVDVAVGHAERSARCFAGCVEHPTDLGVLWMINSSMVIGTRVLRQYLGNVRAYYRGEEYWGRVDWDLLFGTCPHPSYGTDTVAPSPVAPYEPG